MASDSRIVNRRVSLGACESRRGLEAQGRLSLRGVPASRIVSQSIPRLRSMSRASGDVKKSRMCRGSGSDSRCWPARPCSAAAETQGSVELPTSSSASRFDNDAPANCPRVEAQPQAEVRSSSDRQTWAKRIRTICRVESERGAIGPSIDGRGRCSPASQCLSRSSPCPSRGT